MLAAVLFGTHLVYTNYRGRSPPTQGGSLVDLPAAFAKASGAVQHLHGKLYGYLAAAASTSDNIVYSPLSSHIALSMAREGAAGSTLGEMTSVLCSRDSGDECGSLGALSQGLQSSAGPLRLANGIWTQSHYSVLPSYKHAVTSDYASAWRQFGSTDQAVRDINGFVRDSTAGKIPKLLESLPGTSKMVLVNALYFKADWATQFKATNTQEQGTFHGIDGTTITAPMMNRYGADEAYGQHDIEGVKFRSLTLKYAGDQYSMLLMLPEESGPSALARLEKVASSGGGTLDLVRSQQRTEHLSHIAIPRFKAKWSGSLRQALESAGMPTAFTNAADFSRMTPANDLRIYDVVHSALIDVNEQGTEAAAATAVIMVAKSVALAREAPTFVADRPFLFALRHEPSGAVLFAGRVMDPTQQ